MTPQRPDKLPVPGPWQSAVLTAMSDLASRLELPRHAVAVTRVEEEHWRQNEGGDQPADVATRHGLSIWLMAGGRTHRYRADAETGAVAATY